MNFLLVIVLALSFAATSHKLDNWYFFMPVVWLLLLYFMVLTTGTNLLESRPAAKAAFPTAVSPKNDSGSAKMNCFDASKGDKFRVAFGALLAQQGRWVEDKVLAEIVPCDVKAVRARVEQLK